MGCAGCGGDGKKKLPREGSSPSNLGQMAFYFATPVSNNWKANTKTLAGEKTSSCEMTSKRGKAAWVPGL